MNRGIAWVDLGRLEQAQTDMERCAELAEELALTAVQAYANAHLGRIIARLKTPAERRACARPWSRFEAWETRCFSRKPSASRPRSPTSRAIRSSCCRRRGRDPCHRRTGARAGHDGRSDADS